MFEEYELPDSVVFRGFEPDTFAFLAELQTNNTVAWMSANDERYHRVLREPLRALFKALAPIVLRLNPSLETDPKYGRVLASIRRQWADAERAYQDYLWGAFYRANRTRHTDAQLFVTVYAEGVRIGTSVPIGAVDVLEAFRTRLRSESEHFDQLLSPLVADGWIKTDFEDYLLIQRHYHLDDDIIYQPAFADEISHQLERLYPVYRFIVGEEFTPSVAARQPDTMERLAADTLLSPETVSHAVELLREKRQIIFYGPPGTGKTFIARRLAQHVVGTTGEIHTVQFHPSYAYEEFIEGIRPHSDDGQISYPVEAGIFRRLCDAARMHPDGTYVLLIDEVNRGNLPRIFGELLYLLEYRDPTEAVTLPYSKTRFTIPHNVYLIGTMNAADRTLTTLDHAVRRRFHFIPLKPDPAILRKWLHQQGNERMIWAAELLEALNRRLERDGFDWHMQIGHTVFMVRDLTEHRLQLIWEHSIMPTLEEYYYNRDDWRAHYDFASLRAQLSHA